MNPNPNQQQNQQGQQSRQQGGCQQKPGQQQNPRSGESGQQGGHQQAGPNRNASSHTMKEGLANRRGFQYLETLALARA